MYRTWAGHRIYLDGDRNSGSTDASCVTTSLR